MEWDLKWVFDGTEAKEKKKDVGSLMYKVTSSVPWRISSSGDWTFQRQVRDDVLKPGN